MRRMSGGTSSTVHAVDVSRSRDSMLRLVLRRHLMFHWLQEEPDLAEKEAATSNGSNRSGSQLRTSWPSIRMEPSAACQPSR